jgi:2,4-dienoyl-CoA reductase-like NADH-dependent reductase (Old Yellow Enzyme family)
MHLLEYTKNFRAALKNSKLTFTTNVINLDNAEFVLENGMADFVGMFRPFLADPDIVNKYARNKPGDVNQCIRCEYHGRFIRHMPMTSRRQSVLRARARVPRRKVPKRPIRLKR